MGIFSFTFTSSKRFIVQIHSFLTLLGQTSEKRSIKQYALHSPVESNHKSVHTLRTQQRNMARLFSKQEHLYKHIYTPFTRVHRKLPCCSHSCALRRYQEDSNPGLSKFLVQAFAGISQFQIPIQTNVTHLKGPSY